MTKWKSVYNELPEPFEIVWIYWRDREVLLGCRTADDCEPNECWYSFEDEKCKGTSWWMSNKDAGCDKPNPPNPPDHVDVASDKPITFTRYNPLTEFGRNILITETPND